MNFLYFSFDKYRFLLLYLPMKYFSMHQVHFTLHSTSNIEDMIRYLHNPHVIQSIFDKSAKEINSLSLKICIIDVQRTIEKQTNVTFTHVIVTL